MLNFQKIEFNKRPKESYFDKFAFSQLLDLKLKLRNF